MDIRIQSWLHDISKSIDEIFLFLGERRDFKSYLADIKTKKAVERNLEIIGDIVHPKFKTDELIKKHLKFKPNEYTKNEAKIFV